MLTQPDALMQSQVFDLEAQPSNRQGQMPHRNVATSKSGLILEQTRVVASSTSRQRDHSQNVVMRSDSTSQPKRPNPSIVYKHPMTTKNRPPIRVSNLKRADESMEELPQESPFADCEEMALVPNRLSQSVADEQMFARAKARGAAGDGSQPKVKINFHPSALPLTEGTIVSYPEEEQIQISCNAAEAQEDHDQEEPHLSYEQISAGEHIPQQPIADASPHDEYSLERHDNNGDAQEGDEVVIHIDGNNRQLPESNSPRGGDHVI